MTILTPARPPRRAGRDHRSFLLQRAQPAMTGLIDGSLSTLTPIFAVALATHQPHYAFLAGLATALGAGVSMAFSEGLSDTRAHPPVATTLRVCRPADPLTRMKEAAQWQSTCPAIRAPATGWCGLTMA